MSILDLTQEPVMTDDELEKINVKRDKRFTMRREAREDDEISQLISDVSNFVNRSTHGDYRLAASLVTCEHRYLQQGMFNLFLYAIKQWAEDYEHSQVKGAGHHYDARNEHAVKCSYEIVKHLEEKGLI